MVKGRAETRRSPSSPVVGPREDGGVARGTRAPAW